MFEYLLCAFLSCAPTGTTINAASIYVVDGDTIKINEQSYRLLGYDTPETYRADCPEEKALGMAATKRLRDLIDAAQTVTLDTTGKPDKYRRVLAHLNLDGVDVGQSLIGENLAVPYDGGKRISWCDVLR